MAGGGKQVVINTLERALSIDINRLQLFEQANIGELLRFYANVGTGSDELDAGGVLTQISTLNSPLAAEIFNGFCVRPGIGVVDLSIDPGVAYVIAPDSDPDSSNYKLVRDPGLASGSITIGANGTGSTRIDIVEASPVSLTPETDSRDIFNPSTNAFVASTVTKAVQTGFTYRVRAGTPGGGFPGTATGWLPLAIASVPAGSSTNDTVTFWDVRPVAQDRMIAPTAASRSSPKIDQLNWWLDSVTNGGHAILTGEVQATASTYRLGGRLRRGTPGTDSPVGGIDGVDLQDVANLSTGSFATHNYLYLLEPFGLPRWARYTDSSSGSRRPRSPRGILVVSSVAPKSYTGAPSAVVALPASTGLSGSTSQGVCIGEIPVSAGNVQSAACANRILAIPNYLTAITGVPSTTTIKFGLVEGTSHPPFARAIYGHVTVAFASTANSNLLVTLTDSGLYNAAGVLFSGGTFSAPMILGSNATWHLANATAGVLALQVTIPVVIPLMLGYPGTTTNTSAFRLQFSVSVAGGNFSPHSFLM